MAGALSGSVHTSRSLLLHVSFGRRFQGELRLRIHHLEDLSGDCAIGRLDGGVFAHSLPIVAWLFAQLVDHDGDEGSGYRA